MAAAINAGKDLHALVAAKVTGKAESDVTSEERQKAKPINFGKSGGMGDTRLKEHAKSSYGLELTDRDVHCMTDAWFELFPEMRQFLDDHSETGLEIAELFGLTPQAHFEHTRDRRFLYHPENAGFQNVPHPILGWMLLKTIRDEHPQTNANVPYAAADIDFFWSRVQSQPQLFPRKLQEPIRNRRASKRLYSAVRNLVGRRGVFALTGRLRAAAAYGARHNTVFQGLAADGAKLALWQLFRAGYRIVNFIHDEIVIEVPLDQHADEHVLRIREIMITAMQEVVPDIHIDVEVAVMECWSKRAAVQPT
jgi:DNA polymerase I-like protein with 3'-5' exonuclease and polymerase domains